MPGRRHCRRFRCGGGAARSRRCAPELRRIAAQAPAPASSAAVVDPGVGDWRQANRRVLDAGGWRALLRESQAASAPAGAHHHH
ncbi:hypothetical protein [Roseateles chitinivorans]|uniref:hypothetical protein n=1 Tax=Roseateles chitinivorans TaxID=2917965 RepID=UPI003D677107